MYANKGSVGGGTPQTYKSKTAGLDGREQALFGDIWSRYKVIQNINTIACCLFRGS